MFGRCLPKSVSYRRIPRWEHEDVMDQHRQQMADNPDMMRERSAGMDHFLTQGLDKCGGEFSLMSLGCNFRLVLSLVGTKAVVVSCPKSANRDESGMKNQNNGV